MEDLHQALQRVLQSRHKSVPGLNSLIYKPHLATVTCDKGFKLAPTLNLENTVTLLSPLVVGFSVSLSVKIW